MRGSIEINGRVILAPRQWIEVTLKAGKGVGRFSGVWENPTLGWMWELTFFRYYKEPSKRTSLFGSIKPGPIDEEGDPIWNAVPVVGPMSRTGKAPKRMPPPVRLRVIEGGKVSR